VIRRAASLFAIACAIGAGCIVTDEIEFEDKVNNPPQVLTIVPPNEQIQHVCKKSHSYGFTVWDPDEGDAASYGARSALRIDPTEIVQPKLGNCSITPVGSEGEQVEGLETGVRLQVTCEIDLAVYAGVEEGEYLFVEVQVSDLGYVQTALPEGARTAEVLWVLEVSPDSWCEDWP